MKLVNYGTGEVSDRLTILALKIRAGSDAAKDVTHFETERAALLTKLRARTLNAVWFEAFIELAAVNAFLWQAEDELRDLRVGQPDPDRTVEVAFKIQALNDRRAMLVEQINKEAGDTADKEKL